MGVEKKPPKIRKDTKVLFGLVEVCCGLVFFFLTNLLDIAQ